MLSERLSSDTKGDFGIMAKETVTWVWFGKQGQINSTPGSPATQQEANSVVGHHAVGPDQIKPIDVTGDTRSITVDGRPTQAFATTYNDSSTSGMTYMSPATGRRTTSEITGFLEVKYELTIPDSTAEGGMRTEEQAGVLIQMKNGDMFFRPAKDTVVKWDHIDSLRAITITSATPLNANTYVATISFNLDIFDTPIVCFTAGTMILTDAGERRAEDLQPGDLVWTRDHGFQPLRWRGGRSIGSAELARRPNLRPVRIRAGSLGADQPRRDLAVSPQHRVLVRSAIAQRMFGTSELLVAAKQLLELPGIDIDDSAVPVTYVHLMFDRHEGIMSNGAETESLYPGPQAILGLGAAAEEIFALFPALRDRTGDFPTVRPFATGRKARQMAMRHAANEQPLLS